MPSATNSHFEVLFPVILGLTLPSEENRSCCALGKSSHWGLWITRWSCSHRPENIPSLAGKLSRVWWGIPGTSCRLSKAPKDLAASRAAGHVGAQESTEKRSENCRDQPGSPQVDRLGSCGQNLVLFRCFSPLFIIWWNYYFLAIIYEERLYNGISV